MSSPSPERLPKVDQWIVERLDRLARIERVLPSPERLREMADCLDFLDRLAVWVANREGWEFGQPGTKQQRELRALADALAAQEGES